MVNGTIFLLISSKRANPAIFSKPPHSYPFQSLHPDEGGLKLPIPAEVTDFI